jgi:catechol 2,3-dioxygenase-like lactoylglutathione lyase family enzyme
MSTTDLRAGAQGHDGRSGFALRLHHEAYKCRNAEETRHFYEDILGMPLAHSFESQDRVSPAGEVVSSLYFSFQMSNGSYISFFDLGDGKFPAPDPETPGFSTHFAMLVKGEEVLQDLMRRLNEHGVIHQGPIEQQDYVRSVYVNDPNGLRLEFTYQLGEGLLDPDPVIHDRMCRELLRSWTAEHESA